MSEEAASERKTLETDETPDGQTPEEYRVAPGLCPHKPCPSPSADTHRHALGSGRIWSEGGEVALRASWR